MFVLADLITNNVTWIIIWAVVFIAALVIELTTEQLVSIWFCGGSAISLILAICNIQFWIQLIVFVVLSGSLIAFAELYIKKKVKNKDIPTNSDSLIGQEITLTKEASSDAFGEGKIRDVVWSVTPSKESDTIKAGEKAIIKKIEGNHLVIERKE